MRAVFKNVLLERKIDGRNAKSECHLAPAIDAIFDGLSVTDLYTQGNYPRENNAKMTQWKLYVIQVEEILYAR